MGPNGHPYPAYGHGGIHGAPGVLPPSPFVSLGGYMAAVAGGRKPFEGNGSPLLPSPAAANLAAAAAGVLPQHAAAASMLARLPGAGGILPHPNYPNPLAASASSYRHPFLPGLPGLGALAAAGAANPYHSASFHTLLAGLSAQRQKLNDGGGLPPEYQSLLSAALPGGNLPGIAPPSTSTASDPRSSPSDAAPLSPKEALDSIVLSKPVSGKKSPGSNPMSPKPAAPQSLAVSPNSNSLHSNAESTADRRLESIANLKLKAEEHKLKIENGQKLEV